MLDHQKLFESVSQYWDKLAIPSLCEYIKIPNKSPHFDPDWAEHGHMDKAVKHIAQWCTTHGPKNMRVEILQLDKRTPIILMDIPGAQTQEDTILLYGHLDKQPEMTGWNIGLGPWEPVIDGDRLYGRGAADDGYAAYAAILAIRTIQEQGIEHPRCVVLIEACEESGSFDLPFYIEYYQEKIGSPALVICLDSGAGNYEQLWMTTSLRGNVVGELSVSLLREGVHSGNASGIVADSFRVVRQLLSRLEDDITGDILLSDLHCDIPPARINQAADCAEILTHTLVSSFPFLSGAKPVSNNLQQLILNRTWRPTLTITGADGLPPIADAGNVLRSDTTLKLSVRLPPLVDSVFAAKMIRQVLMEKPPYDAHVEFIIHDQAMGWHAPIMSEKLSKTVSDASMLFYHKPPAYMGEGGTIPFMAMLGEKFPKAEFMITGVLGPNSNAHGPNEFLHIDMAKKLTASVAYVIGKYAQ